MPNLTSGAGFNDAAALLTSITQQATGQQVITPTTIPRLSRNNKEENYYA